MPENKNKKINSEEPLIYKTGELLKKLIAKGKRQGFLKRDECENILEEGQFDLPGLDRGISISKSSVQMTNNFQNWHASLHFAFDGG